LYAKGLLKEIPPGHSEKQYRLLTEILKSAGYEHYEISNFAMPGKYSLHNSGYWSDMKYFGFGPSAHSYNGKRRCDNVSNLYKYIKSVWDCDGFYDCEDIDETMAYNDYVLVSLRTMWGVDLKKLKKFGSKYYNHFMKVLASKYEGGDLVANTPAGYRLTEKGFFLSDGIIADFFVV
jgi:oxygen-independent coproporphyrinogen-3 oxidase